MDSIKQTINKTTINHLLGIKKTKTVINLKPRLNTEQDEITSLLEAISRTPSSMCLQQGIGRGNTILPSTSKLKAQKLNVKCSHLDHLRVLNDYLLR